MPRSDCCATHKGWWRRCGRDYVSAQEKHYCVRAGSHTITVPKRQRGDAALIPLDSAAYNGLYGGSYEKTDPLLSKND
jgi:hypothetical protein